MVQHVQNTILKAPAIIRMVAALFAVNAVIWLSFGVLTLARADESGMSPGVAWVLSGFMFANALAMLWAGWGLGNQRRGYFVLAVIILAANILLTITDDFGIFDLLTLLIDFITLGLLFPARKMLKNKSAA